MDEKRLYTWFELFRVVFCGLISIVGVWLIVHKPNNKLKKCQCNAIRINQKKKEFQDQVDIKNIVEMFKKVIMH